MPLQPHKDGGINCFVLKEPVGKVMDWEHLPRDQIVVANKRPAWVGHPKE